MGLLALHVQLLLGAMHLKLTRLLDHFFGYLFEGPLILVDYFQNVEPCVVFVTCVA